MKEQKQRSNEGGITLIALVVTIIILLILAGITLSLVLSDGGLIDKSKEAIAEHKSAQEKEQGELSEATGMMKNLIDGLGSTGGTTPQPPTPPTTSGTGSDEIASNLKLAPWQLDKVHNNLRLYKKWEIEDEIKYLSQMDYFYKSGLINRDVVLINYIFHIC